MNTIVTKTEIKLDSKPARTRNAKPVYCITDGKVYASGIDAAESNSIHPNTISAVCLGKIKTAKGKKYCFVSDMQTRIIDVSDAMQNAVKDAQIYRAKEMYEQKKDKLTKEIENYKTRLATSLQHLDELEAVYAAMRKE